jgi:pyruvate kinase
MRRTKIVCTIGPATRSPENLRLLLEAGMNVARLNFSHGSHAQHAEVVTHLRAIARDLDMPLTTCRGMSIRSTCPCPKSLKQSGRGRA